MACDGQASAASAPSQPFTVLLLSNGHGEDAVAAAIGRELECIAHGVRLLAAPLVGDGLAYRRAGIPVITPTRTMPSGGFLTLKRIGPLWQDLRAGLIGLHLRQAWTLNRLAPRINLVVGVGDRLILYATRWILKRPLFFVAIADSAYLTGGRVISNPGERQLMRACARMVFTRDALSAELLRAHGVPATFVGNPMMDTFRITGAPLGGDAESSGRKIIALLPGSRPEAYRNFRIILDGVACSVEQGTSGVRFVTAWPEHLPLGPLREALHGTGWELSGVDATGGGPMASEGLVGRLTYRNGAVVELVTGRFGDVLHHATLVIGLAGTANEQAAGLGKPVITCPGTGPQVTPELVRRQQLLLGDAVEAVEPNGPAIARAVREILSDPERYRRMSEAGRARMGPPGAARRIAQTIVEEFATCAGTRTAHAPRPRGP